MDNYCEITIKVQDESLKEILIAHLASLGYEGFEESGEELKAYLDEAGFNEIELNNLLSNYNLNYSKSIIKKQNWNQLWESNFEPVLVDNFVGVRADFHSPFSNVQHEIIITPKMSFGTGHHATTFMMMQLMRELDFSGKRVFDFGTGTGILAILAEKIGAAYVLAVDNDDWCIENASENISINNCKYIDIQKNETAEMAKQFDIIIANINRNIILDNLVRLKEGLTSGGQLLLSGLLESDEAGIRSACTDLGFIYQKTLRKNGWIALQF